MESSMYAIQMRYPARTNIQNIQISRNATRLLSVSRRASSSTTGSTSMHHSPPRIRFLLLLCSS